MSTTKTKLDTGLIRELAAILSEADLGELEVEHEGLRIRVSKPAVPVIQAAAYAPPVAAPAPATPAPATAGAEAPPAASSGVSANAIRSPMAGSADRKSVV